MVTSTVAASSLTAGAIHSQLGWQAMSLAASLPLTVVFAGLVWLAFYQRRQVMP